MLPLNQHNPPGSRPAADFLRPGMIFVVIIFGALAAFELFNYSTTDLALRDLLGDLTFAGVHWATILALAFCGIDFAGVARLFTPEQGIEEPKEVWYLFGAWLIAATMNAILTWWGVSMAVTNHVVQSSTVVDPQTIRNVVPIFVAIMVWIIRILIIGTLSLALERLSQPGVVEQPRPAFDFAIGSRIQPQPRVEPPARTPASIGAPAGLAQRVPLPRTAQAAAADTGRSRVEPSYHSMAGSKPGTRR